MQTHLLALDSPLFWGAMLLTLGVVSLAIYLYSGKDLRLTSFFAFLALAIILVVAGYDDWLDYLQIHFVGRFDESGVPYRVSRPGLLGFWDAWPLWIMPTLLFSALLTGGLWVIQRFFAPRSFTQHADKVDAETTTSPQPTSSTPAARSSSQSVNLQLELETLKRSLITSRDKLAKAEHAKNQAETTLRELQKQTLQMSQSSTSQESLLSDQMKVLELERDGYLSANNELSQQLALQTEEIAKLKTLIAKLVKK